MTQIVYGLNLNLNVSGSWCGLRLAIIMIPKKHGAKFGCQTNNGFLARGWGTLKNNHFGEVPKDWWEMDCKSQLKNP